MYGEQFGEYTYWCKGVQDKGMLNNKNSANGHIPNFLPTAACKTVFYWAPSAMEVTESEMIQWICM